MRHGVEKSRILINSAYGNGCDSRELLVETGNGSDVREGLDSSRAGCPSPSGSPSDSGAAVRGNMGALRAGLAADSPLVKVKNVLCANGHGAR